MPSLGGFLLVVVQGSISAASFRVDAMRSSQHGISLVAWPVATTLGVHDTVPTQLRHLFVALVRFSLKKGDLNARVSTMEVF